MVWIEPLEIVFDDGNGCLNIVDLDEGQAGVNLYLAGLLFGCLGVSGLAIIGKGGGTPK